MGRRLAWLSTALVLLAGLGYQMLVHAAVTGGLPPWLRLVLKLVPLAGVAIWAALRAQRKGAWLGGLAAAAALVVWMDHLPESSDLAFGLPHAAIYLSLFALFGRTMLPGQTPLITQIALRVHGTTPPLAPAYWAYTRTVTIAWCVFFIAEVLASLLLYAYAPHGVWALYITVIHFPLVLLMFVAEYAVRRLFLRDYPRVTIPTAIRAFTEHHTAPAEAEQQGAVS